MAAVAWAHPPSQATVCDDNPDVAQIVYGGGKLYQRHYDGSIHLFNGPNQYWRWTTIQGAGDTLVGIAANHKHLYKMKTNGELSRYNEATQAWDLVKTLIHIKDYVISDSKFYYLKGIHGGASEGIQMEDIDDPSPSYEELEGLLKQVQTRSKSQDNEISRLKAGKEADEKIINQLRNENRDYQAQVTKLTTDLKAARDQAAKTKSDLQSQIASLQKDLLAAQNAEKKLSQDLDTEKKKEHDEWKKSQEHDAEDHKALDQAHQALQESQALGAELQKQVDSLNEEVSTTKAANEKLKDEVADAKAQEALAEAELKKHKNDDAAEEQIIEGLEEVIKGLKKEVHGQQELLSAYKKQLQKGNIKLRDPSNKFFMDVLRHE